MLLTMMSESRPHDSPADKIDRLLSTCAFLAVLIGVFQWAEHHYVRAVLAVVLFLVVAPWLGRRWIKLTFTRREDTDHATSSFRQ
jgi:hypothetical protein